MGPIGILRECQALHQPSSPIAVDVYKYITLILSVIVKFMVPVLIFQTEIIILQAFFKSQDPNAVSGFNHIFSMVSIPSAIKRILFLCNKEPIKEGWVLI